MRIKLFAVVFLAHACASVGLAQEVAAAARGAVAASIKAPVAVDGGPLTQWDLPQGDRATLDTRLKRAQEEWSRFLREKTKDGKAPAQDGYRVFDELGFWRVFMDTGHSDELVRVIEKRAGAVARLGHALKAAKTKAEMELDSASRDRVIGLIEQATREVERWKQKPQEANAARSSLRAILPQFLQLEAAK